MDTMQTSLTQPQRVAVARLHALLELLPTALDKRMAEASLTAFEFTLLEALQESTEGKVRLSALASRTNATLPRLSRVVTALERKGLVVRQPCAEDGRAFNAVLTAEGRDRYEESRALHADAVRSMVLDDLTDDEVDDFALLCLKILGRLDPDRRLDVTACLADPQEATGQCPADPVEPTCSADPKPVG